MMMNHDFTLDLLVPGTPHRIQVKQGDTLTHSLNIRLLTDGNPWPFPVDTAPVLRWHACDPGSGESASGIYDTLPDGVHAWQATENLLTILTVPQMFALPGLVTADIALIQGERILATWDFEFYVVPAPADGTEPEAQSYYKVATLEQINEAITALQVWQASTDRLLAGLEHQVFEIEKYLQNM